MKTLFHVAFFLCAAILLNSCASNNHIELVGHYKPKTDVAKKSVTNSAYPSANVIQPIPAQNEIAEATPESPANDITSGQSEQQPFMSSSNDKQQQRFEKKLEKIKVKVENHVAKNTTQEQPKNLSSNKHKQKLSAGDSEVLLVILAILLPPLAVGLYEDGLTTHFWISVLLTLLFWIPGVIYALIIILG